MISPAMPVRGLSEYTHTISGPVWRAFHIWVFTKLLSEGSCLPYLPPNLRQLNSQELSLTRENCIYLLELHLFIGTTLFI